MGVRRIFHFDAMLNHHSTQKLKLMSYGMRSMDTNMSYGYHTDTTTCRFLKSTTLTTWTCLLKYI